MRFDEFKIDENPLAMLKGLKGLQGAKGLKGLGGAQKIAKDVGGMLGIGGNNKAQGAPRSVANKAQTPDTTPGQPPKPMGAAPATATTPATVGGAPQKATAPGQQMAEPNPQDLAKAQKAADAQTKASKKNLQQQIKLTKQQLSLMQKQLQGMK